ncbi:MAG: cell surface protein SprA, partial [Tannerella sp.]|nr:cell surface protein SprA [Tannerella sp.]
MIRRAGHTERCKRSKIFDRYARCYKGILLVLFLLFFQIVAAQTNTPPDSTITSPPDSTKTLPPDSTKTLPPDSTIAKPHEKPLLPVKKTIPEEYNDLTKKNNSAADLKDPENIKKEVEYDLKTGNYLFKSKIGDMTLGTPMLMTPEEYMDYSLRQSLDRYFQEKNRSMLDSAADRSGGGGGRSGNVFNPLDLQLDIGAADKIFGPGGVKLQSQGTIGLDIGLKTSSTSNPALPERSRSRTFFNFNTDVNMTTRASVGTKVNFDLNYNTGAQFDFDQSKLRLNYVGEEDEIVKVLEGGNVSLTTNNSLVRGGSALFGVKADLQFGKLNIRTVVAQQESDAYTSSSKGGSQMTDYEIVASDYDENRHYFLAHYFRDNYDRAMTKLPYISSGISINRIEVWVTNKSSKYDQSRNIVSFSDLAENSRISNPQFTPTGTIPIPYNGANNLYRTIVDNYSGAREISAVTQVFDGFIDGGRDYEKIESARMLSTTDYTLNNQLGYISLNARLQADEALAVAYEFIYDGKVYQVGEFSSDNSENTNNCLYLKTIKGTSSSPAMPFWDLMMKNVYNIPGASSVQREKFRLDIVYQSDTAGTYVYSIPEGEIKNKTLIKVMNLDRLNSRNEAVPGGNGDGFFDFVEGYTVVAGSGRIIFPVVEPFGEHL